MEEKIKELAKLEAIKKFINSLQEEYEKLQDTDDFDDLQSFQKNEINGKVEILTLIKDFINNI